MIRDVGIFGVFASNRPCMHPSCDFEDAAIAKKFAIEGGIAHPPSIFRSALSDMISFFVQIAVRTARNTMLFEDRKATSPRPNLLYDPICTTQPLVKGEKA
ncbi:MAG: hypothetical protein ISN28_13805 [Ectothiorhodospiraceae bacterium AqS1]|nr:hypothetical protein [Ectothiorhodospiraceae bacterium AqS1]